MAKLFCILSGEHENLPTAEIRAIFEAEGYNYKMLEQLDQVVRLEASLDSVEALKRRAALTRVCALELFNCRADIDIIIKAMRSTDLDETLRNQTFAVRVKHVKEYSSGIDGMMLERKLGDLALAKNKETKVNLKKPSRTLIGVLTSGRFIFGMKLSEILPKPFVERRPRRKPFFHPSAMQAKLARCMVNLARPKAGDLVLDPFCGTGSMLIESALIGCQIVGLDVQRRMVKGTLKNLFHFGIEYEGVLVADARKMPTVRADCVVTDPPYGISSATFKRTTGQLVEELLASVYPLLGKGRRICMSAPKTLKIRELGPKLGYRPTESHLVYVHRSLTREIVVFEKV